MSLYAKSMHAQVLVLLSPSEAKPMKPKLYICKNEPPIHPEDDNFIEKITELQNDFA